MPSATDILRFAASVGLDALRSGGVSAAADTREAAAEAAFPPVGRIVEVEGVPVHVHIEGAGPDLVMIHGAGGNLRDATFRLAPMLADRYRVVAFDRPGHGYTGPASPSAPHWDRFGESPTGQADLLRRAAAQLGVTRPLVLGHSYGAAVALAWALSAPDAAAGLVLLAGASMPWPGGLAASYHVNASDLGGATVVPLIAAFATDAQAREVLETIFAPDPVPAGYEAHFGLPLSIRRASLRANARQVTALRPHVVEMAARYPALDLPVALLHGTADSIVPLRIHSAPLSEILPQAELSVLNGVGHMPQHAAPGAVAAIVDRTARRAGLRIDGPGSSLGA